MAAQPGKLFLLRAKVDESFVSVLSARTNDMSISSELTDVTTKAANGWRTGLQGAGIASMTLSAEGVYTDAAYERAMQVLAKDGIHEEFEIVSGGGQKWAGTFQFTSYARAGAQSGEETFTFTLESAGVVLLHSLSTTVEDQGESDFDESGSNGSFEGGSGHVVSDEITLDDGTVITVDAVDDGEVIEFTVTTAGDEFYFPEDLTLVQESSTGSGIGFVLNLGANNVVAI